MTEIKYPWITFEGHGFSIVSLQCRNCCNLESLSCVFNAEELLDKLEQFIDTHKGCGGE